MTDCRTVEPRLEEYRVDLLPAEEKQSVEAHLAGCAPCSDVLAKIRSIEEALLQAADSGPSRESMNAGLARVQAALPRKTRWKERIPMAAAALALLGTFVWLLGGPPSPPTPATQDSKGIWEEKRLAALPENFDATSLVWSPSGRSWAGRIAGGDKKWHVVIDGKPGPPFASVDVPVFSPDGKKAAYVAVDADGKQFVVSGETRGEKFNEVLVSRLEHSPTEQDVFRNRRTVLWAPDSHAFAYQGHTTEGTFVVVGTTKRGPYRSVRGLCWCPDSRTVAFEAQIASDSFVVVGDRKGEIFDGVSQLTFSPDGTSVAYLAREGARWLVMRGERRMPSDGSVGPPVFSPDGTSLAYVTGSEETPNRLIIDGKYSKMDQLASQLADPVFSPDGKRVAIRAKNGRQAFIIVDGHGLLETFDSVGVPFFSPDGSTVAYVATRGSKQLAVVGSDIGEKFSKVEPIVFSPDGKTVSYRGERFGKQVVVAGKALSEEFDAVVAGPFYSSDSKKVSFVVRQGLELWSKFLDVK
jgi:Tol biopolymer transport system component